MSDFFGLGSPPNHIYQSREVFLRLEKVDIKEALYNECNKEQYQKAYQFFLDICGEAYYLYEKWKKHQGFKGTGLKGTGARKIIKRDNQGKILNVRDGLIFPILVPLSEFITKKNGRWTIRPPFRFDEKNFIDETMKETFMEIAGSNPNIRGEGTSLLLRTFKGDENSQVFIGLVIIPKPKAIQQVKETRPVV